MSTPTPYPVLVTYQPKEGKESQLLELLRGHWPALRSTGLVTDTPVRFWRGEDKSGQVYFVESFEWRDAEARTLAHQTPEVMAVWEPMGPILADMRILHVEPLSL